MIIEKINNTNWEEINSFIIKQWYTLQMIVHGEIINLSDAEGWYVLIDNEIAGLITYRHSDNMIEILSLDSLYEHQGIGTALLRRVIQEAKDIDAERVVLTTTNDNLSALRFYQKRGFDICKLRINAVEQSRKIKPEVPLFSADGIPIKHEIELELIL